MPLKWYIIHNVERHKLGTQCQNNLTVIGGTLAVSRNSRVDLQRK